MTHALDPSRLRTAGGAPPAVELHDVSRRFGSGQARVQALDRLTVAFPTGSWTAVMGPSGSGKSTLLHCAAGLERVDTGQVRVVGVDVTRASDAERTVLRRDRVGFVFQGLNLVGSLTAAQNVALPLRLAGRRPRAAQVRAVLGSVGLADRGRRRPRELSGGQQQRVAIARAMVTRPDVLFADEPTGALDSTAARGVLDLLRGMVDNAGQTVVMVTHDPVAAARADSVLFLRDGALVDRLDRPDVHGVADRLARLEG